MPSIIWRPMPPRGLSHFISFVNYNNNLIGSVNLINAAVNFHQVECFCLHLLYCGLRRRTISHDRSDDSGAGGSVWDRQDCRGTRAAASRTRCSLVDYIRFSGPGPQCVRHAAVIIADRYRNVVGIFMNQRSSASR